MKADLFEDIINKFLDGVATAHEKRMLANWLKEDREREEVFYRLLSNRETEHPQTLPDLDTKIADYEAFLKGERPRSALFREHTISPDLRPRRMSYYRWAASIIFVLAIGAYYLSNDSLFYKTYHAQSGTIRLVPLQDGSTVTLNANSYLRVPRDFGSDNNREVWIRGEAFFEVARQEDFSRFVVHTGNVDVQVLGTKFNVNNRRGKTEVTLNEGKVKLVSKDSKVVVMKPGEQVSVSSTNMEFEKKIVDTETYTAWKSNKLLFENTPLSEVALIIEDYYGLHVVLNDSLLSTRRFTGTLPNNDLDVIIMALSTAYNIEIEQRDDEIIIK